MADRLSEVSAAWRKYATANALPLTCFVESCLNLNQQETSSRLWFIRGTAGGVLLFAAANALSWFFRSDSWSGLVGGKESGNQALGFPFEIWRERQFYTYGTVIDLPWVLVDVLIGLVFAAVCGTLAIRFREQLSPLLQVPTAGSGEGSTKLSRTFSLRGLFVATTIAAVFIAAAQALGPSSPLLFVIYLAGPAVLITIAMVPLGMHWKQRAVLLVLFAAVLLGACVFVGHRLGMDFDRVLMGVYICWVPQSVFAALLLLLWSLFVKTDDRSDST